MHAAGPHAELAESIASGGDLPASIAVEPVSAQKAAFAVAAIEGPATPLLRAGSLRRSGTMPCPSSVSQPAAASSPLVSGSSSPGSPQRPARGTDHASQLEATLPRSVSLSVPSSVTKPPGALQRTLSAPAAQSSFAESRCIRDSAITEAVSTAALMSLAEESQRQGVDRRTPASRRSGECRVACLGAASMRFARGHGLGAL